MNLYVNQVNYPFMWCHEKAIATISTYMKRNYEMSFCELWNFDFVPQKSFEGIGDRIFIKHDSRRIERLLNEYHGIEFKNYIVDSKEVWNIAHNEIGNGNPILTQMETPYFLWDNDKMEINEGYKTLLLVTGFSDDNEFVHCIDLHNNRSGDIPKDLLWSSCKNCITYNVTGEELINMPFKYKLEEIINRFYKSNYYDNTIAAMYDFANIIENSLDIKSEVNGRNVFSHSPLISNFDLLMRTRGLFSLTIKLIAEKYKLNSLVNTWQKFSVASNIWDMASKICVKAYYNGRDIRSVVSAKIREAAAIELNIMKEMSDILNDVHIICAPLKTNISPLKQIATAKRKVVYLNIKKVFNNKGIQVSNENNANFTGLGEYFLVNDMPDSEFWKASNMRFQVPIFNQFNNDNIQCEGQIIEVPRGIYNAISFLECSDWGNFFGNLTINFEDDDSEIIVLKFSDWYGSVEQYYKEEIAWISENLDCKMERNKSRIYASSYMVKNKKPIKSIILPNCPNMHIFAISLEE